MTTPLCPFPIQAVRQPAAHGLSQITKSLYLSNAVAAKDKAMLSTNHITTVISVSVEGGDEARPNVAALCCRGEPLCHLLPRLPDEVPLHVAAGRPHVDQVVPPHHPAQQWLLGAAYPL
ncbi:PREDICTED: dual specificity protein phosphatase 21 isoform X2 [Capra hircus]|uniref:dual specificity protein phosphatase 21 isoform X2 n=1 Tax=Capra hircus TaxID=9925 RepID=UPI0006B12124|nr:PREDICTED: dual specificity protein phosphatase 21 isoform X2 [Capra hircus]